MSSEAVHRHLALLSEPLRARLLAVLDEEELGVGELARVLQVPQSTVSRHLRTLHGGGWVARRSEGTTSFYRRVREGHEAAAADLWEVVRRTLDGTPAWAEDRRRLQSVLASRVAEGEAFFGRVQGGWDALRRELFGDDFLLPTLLALLPPELVVADLGCGTGDVVARLAPAVGRVIGIDREAAMLEVAAERTRGMDGVSLRRGTLDALPLQDGEIDAALAMLVLHHVPEPARALAEVHRALKPGGRLVLLDMVPHDRAEWRHTMGHRHLGFSADDLRAAAPPGLDLAAHRLLPPSPEAQGPGLFLATFRRR